MCPTSGVTGSLIGPRILASSLSSSGEEKYLSLRSLSHGDQRRRVKYARGINIATPTGIYAITKSSPITMGTASNPTPIKRSIPNRANSLFADFFDGLGVCFMLPTTLRFPALAYYAHSQSMVQQYRPDYALTQEQVWNLPDLFSLSAEGSNQLRLASDFAQSRIKNIDCFVDLFATHVQRRH